VNLKKKEIEFFRNDYRERREVKMDTTKVEAIMSWADAEARGRMSKHFLGLAQFFIAALFGISQKLLHH